MKTIVLLASIGLFAACALGTADDPAAPLKPAPASPDSTPGTTATAAAPKPSRPTQFDAQLLEIARTYKTYRRVSDMANWAPWMCRGPIPGGVQSSESKDETTHGRKLYFLYAKEASAYLSLGDVPRPVDMVQLPSGAVSSRYQNCVGQVVVKEAFRPVAVPLVETDHHHSVGGAPVSSFPADVQATADDGKPYRIGHPAGLFIMLKLDPKTPDTDDGWVYAVTSPDNKTVLDAGRLASCIGCHEKTDRDRLFGPKWSWPEKTKHPESTPPSAPSNAPPPNTQR